MLVYQRVKHVDTCVFDGFWRMSLSLDLVEIVLLRRWCKQIGGWSGLFICFIGKGNGKGETSMQGNGGLADEFCWLGNWSFESGVDMDVNGPKVYRNTGISYGWDWFQLYSIYSLVPFFWFTVGAWLVLWVSISPDSLRCSSSMARVTLRKRCLQKWLICGNCLWSSRRRQPLRNRMVWWISGAQT